MLTSDCGMKEAIKVNAVEEKKAEYYGSEHKSRKCIVLRGCRWC